MSPYSRLRRSLHPDADGRPTPRASPGRAGAGRNPDVIPKQVRDEPGPENATPEYGSHNVRTLCDVLLSCPHPRCLQAEKSGALQAPHSSTFQQPYGLEQNRSVPPAMLAAWGSLVKSDVVGNARSAVP